MYKLPIVYFYKLSILLNDSGSIDSEDVRRKFVSQKETKDRLTTLKTNTENQKKDLQIKCLDYWLYLEPSNMFIYFS